MVPTPSVCRSSMVENHGSIASAAMGFLLSVARNKCTETKHPSAKGHQHLIIRSRFTQRNETALIKICALHLMRCGDADVEQSIFQSSSLPLCVLCAGKVPRNACEMFLECRTRFSLASVGDSCHDTDTGSWASHSCAELDVESFQGSEITHLYSPAL